MKFILPILIFIAVIGVLFGTNFYLGYRFSEYFNFGTIWGSAWFFTGIMVFMFFGTMRNVNATSWIGHIIFIVATVTMGFYLYLLLSTLLVEIPALFYNTQPLAYGLASFFLAMLVSVYGIWNASNTKITKIGLEIKGLQKPITAVHLTDTHLGHFRGGKSLQKIVNMINKENADIVFFTGDLLDSTYQLQAESMQPLINLKAPVYFIEGNHDKYTGIASIKNYLISIGVKVLSNQIANFGELQIIGLNHMQADHKSKDIHASNEGPTIENTLLKLPIDKDKPAVLLHHSPNGIKHVNKAGVDLYLCGHTHGGQMWPATYIAKMMFDYNRGLHDFNGTKIYVSQGTGTFGPPMRIGTSSELAIFQLMPVS